MVEVKSAMLVGAGPGGPNPGNLGGNLEPRRQF